MTIIEQIEKRSSALRVSELASLLDVTPQHIDKLASRWLIPTFRMAGAIRLERSAGYATWLKGRYPKGVRKGSGDRAA